MAAEKEPTGPADQHKSGFLIRFPESYREALRLLREQTGQPFAVAARRAMDAYLRVHGLTPPGST